jgi:hypothetical protein
MKKESFKSRFALEKRKEEFNKVKQKYPSSLPIIVEKNANCKLPELEKPTLIIEEKLRVLQLSTKLS